MSESLSDFIQREPGQDVWKEYDGGVWWFCMSCRRCVREADIRVWKFYERTDKTGPFEWMTTCPHCDVEHDLYRWAGWPSRVVLEWSPEPNPEKVYRLPDSIYSDSEEPAASP